MVHVLLGCSAFDVLRSNWFAGVDAAFAVAGREAAAFWWLCRRAAILASPTVDGLAVCLAAVGAPQLAAGRGAALRDDLACAFIDTFGEFFSRNAGMVAALPRRR